MIFIFVTLVVSLLAMIILAALYVENISIWAAVLTAVAVFLGFVSTIIILPIWDDLLDRIDELSKDNTEQIQLAIDSVNYAHKTMDEFNDARFQNTAQESYLLWELLHSIYKQDSIRWYKDIRTSPEYKELDRFLVGDWEDFYLY